MKQLILIVLIFVIPALSFCQDITPVISKLDGAIVLDGELNDNGWVNSEVFYFNEFSPDWSVPDTLTKMLLTYDHTNLYIGFIAREPNPDQIIDRSLTRDNWYGDDYVSFHIDPNVSKENSLVFSVYPSANKYDMAVSNDAVYLGSSTFNKAYDMIWRAKTSKSDKGWQAEIQIPISNLRFLADSNGRVKAAISGLRSQNYLNKQSTTPVLPQEMSNAIEAASVKQPIIFEDLIPRKQLQIAPYMLAASNNKQLFNDNTDEYDRKNKKNLDVGLDIRYGISPKLMLDLTYNTDFSQVEIDEQIVNIGDRVNIYMPEKRKFFQEQAGKFDFNLGIGSQLFYSRNIGISEGKLTPIIGGARLTGSIGKTEVGFMSMQTDYIDLGDGYSHGSENFSVIRLRKKVVNNQSFLGFMLTNRMRSGYFNTAAGIDGVIHLPKNLIFISSLAASKDEYDTTQTNLNDHIKYSVSLMKRKTEGFYYTLAYEYSGESFKPEMGFLAREKHQNIWLTLLHGKYIGSKEKSLFKYRRWCLIGSDLFLTPDLSKVITWYNRSSWDATFFSGDRISVFGQLQYEYLTDRLHFTSKVHADSGNYFFAFGGMSFQTADHRFVSFPIGVEYGTFYNGRNLKFTFNPSLNFNKHFILETSLHSNFLVFDQGKTKDWLHIAQIRLNWAMNLHLSGSLISQFNSLAKKVYFSMRFRYNFNDGHDLYLVLNQDHEIYSDYESLNVAPYNNQNLALKYIYTFNR